MGFESKSILKKSVQERTDAQAHIQSEKLIRPEDSYYPSKAYTNKPNFDAYFKKSKWSALLLMALVIASGIYLMKNNDADKSSDKTQQTQSILQNVILGVQDEDLATTKAVKESLLKGEVPKILEQAAPEIKTKILSGEMSFYKFKVFDSVHEDGDIVEIFINGMPFGYIDMNNDGTTISLPLAAGQLQNVAVKGVRDGGGGITFGAQTSSGEIHLRVLDVGETDSFTAKAQ